MSVSLSPEQAAAGLLLAAGLGDVERPPIDVEELAVEHLALDVQEDPDLRALPDAPPLAADVTLSGLLVPARRRIWVSAVEARRSPGRRSFTIAHEIGHWELHRGHGDEAHTRFCRARDVGGTAPELRRAAEIEREANRFAAALLMPEDLVRRQARELRMNVTVLAERFGVSVPAMQTRLDDLRLYPDYPV